jgi:phosphoribosylanthranilate isomerase
MLLKVCGLRELENVNAIAAIKPQWMGFIFSPASPRYFYEAENPAAITDIPNETDKVGVFVNEDEKHILNIYMQHQLDYVQLHGHESVEDCKSLFEKGIRLIKAFGVNDGFDFSITEDYAPYVSFFLFDTAGKSAGGNGIQFNHGLLEGKRFAKPFLLSGGIGPDDALLVTNFRHPDMIGVDVNSRFEISPGLKNTEALKLFKEQIS